MDIALDLPEVLRDLTLSHMTLPEMIQSDVPLTPHRLLTIVNDTLGRDFVNPDDMSALIQDRITLPQPLSEQAGNGLTALFLLDKLPLIPPGQHYLGLANRLVEYWVIQSFQFKAVVYRHLFTTLNRGDYASILSIVGSWESTASACNSGLPIVYALVGPQLLSYVSVLWLFRCNRQFLYEHLDELPLSHEVVRGIAKTHNEELIIALAEKLIEHRGAGLNYTDVQELVEYLRQYNSDLYMQLVVLWCERSDESIGQSSGDSGDDEMSD